MFGYNLSLPNLLYSILEIEMSQTKWIKASKGVMDTPKFLKRGTKVMVTPDAPIEQEVDGKYGKRKMFIINTKEYGLVFVSQLQLVAIAQTFDGNFESAITVEL